MNLLITGAWGNAVDCLSQIEQDGHVISFLQFEKDALPCAYEWVEGVICNALFLYHPIERFNNLKYIQLTSAGFDRIPMRFIEEHHIELHNARGVYSVPMAEFAVSGVLQLYKHSKLFYKNQKFRKWEKCRELMELQGRTVCIVGCGSVGTECAKRFQCFGCNVVGVDVCTRQDVYYSKILPLEDLNTVLPVTDVLVLTLPLTEDTRHLINAERLSILKNSAVLVNIARGAIVDQVALEAALSKNNLFGAVLDVFETEPLNSESLLWDMDNVILTPHNSFFGDNNAKRLNEVILTSIKEVGL